MAVTKLHVKKDDLVMIIAGKDKGKSGKVLRVLPEKERVLVENLNLMQAGRGELAFTLGDSLSDAWKGDEEAGFKTPLNKALIDLGMKSAFDCKENTTADFSGMTGKRNLCISAVVHKAFVEVNELGTEAAAATAVVMSEITSVEQPPPTFRADHPFLFAIRDVRSGALLFVGRMTDPTR